ncbi:TVP38/TMEM64 family protein [Enorma phocaeensis]|uniref:TVP38/TMEM64 family protein n=1 Tax=Enorma phocaeensis TaxID=1871019 RepID=UPI001FE7897D|nr:VTT domain-containing protein [Enorma phocaeensis]
MIGETAMGTVRDSSGAFGAPAVMRGQSTGRQSAGGARRVLTLRQKRGLVIGATVVVLAAILLVCWNYLPGIYAWLADSSVLHAYVAEHAVLSRLAVLGMNALQIMLAFLPGEPIELASGYAFGFWEGTALCLVASAVASSAIYGMVRLFGWKVVGLFFDRKQFERYAWLRDARRLELIMLVVFLIPGTPKDFLTYFAGLTRMRFAPVLAITTLGRIPSIVTSTVAASAFGSGDYTVAIAAVVVACLLALVGGFACKRFEAHVRE